MRISEQTIRHFSDKGVSVRWYAEQTYDEHYKNCWQREFESYVNYYKECVGDNPYANKLFETMEELEEHARKNADTYTGRRADNKYDADRLFIEYDGKTIVKKESVKSKEITTAYVQKLIDKNEKAYSGYYGDFAKNMQRLLKEHGLSNKFSVYPTTYGIGIWVIFNWNAKDDIERVTKILDERGIEYYNEYSEAGWVYRYKVSKRAENILKAAKHGRLSINK